FLLTFFLADRFLVARFLAARFFDAFFLATSFLRFGKETLLSPSNFLQTRTKLPATAHQRWND
ncbi:MAG: hypothetical protein AAF664_24160, partial [Planctomycetota bacterium]